MRKKRNIYAQKNIVSSLHFYAVVVDQNFNVLIIRSSFYDIIS